MKLLPTLSPQERGNFAITFARTMLRVFTFPVPTIAACKGHAIAGGAMLTFACDCRFALDGPYRIQMNETLIGIPLPKWMLLIADTAIPSRWRTEALLHARAYNPQEALERGILHAASEDEDAMEVQVKIAIEKLQKLDLPAYATSKQNQRQAESEHVLEILKEKS